MISPLQAGLIPDHTPIADAGQYFTAGMAPGATVLDYAVLAAFDATKALVVIQNADGANASQPLSVGRNLHLKYLRFTISQAPASSTSAVFASVIDTGTRTPSAGNTARTPVNVLSGSPAAATLPNVWTIGTGGAVITVPAAVSASTVVGNLLLRGQIPIVNDEYLIQFGGTDVVAGNLVTAAPNGASNIVKAHPPIVLAPQHFALLYLWFPGNAATEAKFSGLDLGFTMI